MKKILLLALLPFASFADQCVLQQRTVSQGTVVIQERSGLQSDVLRLPNGSARCQVSMRVRIDNEWHTAFGDFDWPGDRPREQACAAAVKRAEDSVRERVGQSRIVSDTVLVCRDEPNLDTIRTTKPGTVGALHQYRPHPDYPNRFWHNGTQCRWFLDSAYVKNDIRTYQGVICQVHNKEWVVVDKF